MYIFQSEHASYMAPSYYYFVVVVNYIKFWLRMHYIQCLATQRVLLILPASGK